jgi:hypothetical protein
MFGGIAFMVDDKMVASVSKRGLLLRVGKDGQEAALQDPRAKAARDAPGQGDVGLRQDRGGGTERGPPEAVAGRRAKSCARIERSQSLAGTITPRQHEQASAAIEGLAPHAFS